jgi:hypothetical protein
LKLSRTAHIALEAHQVLHLADRDQCADAAGETEDHRAWHIFHVGADLQQRRHHQNEAGEEGGGQHAGLAMLGDEAGDDDDEGRRRAADLMPAAAEGGDQEAGHHGGDQPPVGLDAGTDRNCHRQRQRQDRNRDARQRVLAEAAWRITLAQRDDKLRRERAQVGREVEAGLRWSNGGVGHGSGCPGRR